MKAFFDTSVLVAVFHADHERHAPSLNAFLKFSRREAAAGTHSLAEVFSTLTALPGKHRVAPEQAMLFLQTMRERLTLVTLSEDDYYDAIDAASARAIAGGAIYDALLARCAVKIKAETLYTWNVRDFKRLGPEIAERVRTP
ncbi:MAG TPA: PIN domain-containing protein [Terriglobia bacterium]|nr:PIN domain-containing protein [Terriglobia bacterium]